MDNCCWGMPIAPRAPPKAMRGKCERGHPFSTPGLRFHGVDRADVFNNIRVRAIRCGECALNPPTAQHLPRRRPSPAPTQRHALPEHFRSPTQRRRTPAGCAMHSPPTSPPIPRRRPSLAPSIFSRPSRALPLPHAAPTHARRLRDARPQCAMHSPLPSQPIPRRRPSLAPHSDTPSQTLLLAHAAQMHARRPHDPFPAEELRPSPQRHAASPSVPLRAQKKRHRTVDVRCRMSRSTVVRSVIWVGEPRAVRRRCGALACRRGA